MAALLAHATQLHALHATLALLDPQMATALHAHLQAAQQADTVLRECGIQMATLHTLQVAAGHNGDLALRLRARIDALIAPVTKPRPIAQADGS